MFISLRKQDKYVFIMHLTSKDIKDNPLVINTLISFAQHVTGLDADIFN